MKNKPFKILLCGAFGYGNLGDNLIRDEAVHFFNDYFPEIEVYIDRPYPNKELIDFVDLRIIGPGGLLYDADEDHIKNFLSYCKKPYICMGVGIQFPEVIMENGLIAECSKNSDLIITRHIVDLLFIKKFRSDMTTVYVMPDFGYYFKPNIKIKQYEKELSNNPVIALCPIASNYKNDEISDNILNEIDILLSFSEEDNYAVNKLARRKISQRTTIEYYTDSFNSMYNLLDNVDLLITSRFHAGILATLNQHTKVVSFINDAKNRWYKLNQEFPEKFDFIKLKDNKISYINSIPLKQKTNVNFLISEIDVYRDIMAKEIKNYLESNFKIR